MADLISPRLRGRAGVERRKRMLARFPVCVECKRQGILTPTDEIDHIWPLAHGGPDIEDNMQGLCHPCHEAKSYAEQAWKVENHPDWLRPLLIPITIIAGPPASGKTTMAHAMAKDGDLIIDLDEIMTSVDPDFRPWSGDRSRLDDGIRIRNRMLGSLAFPSAYSAAWFTILAPSPDEQRWWISHLGGTLHVMRTSRELCKERADARGTPAAKQAIDDWFVRSQLPWAPHRSRRAVDDDGWPTN